MSAAHAPHTPFGTQDMDFDAVLANYHVHAPAEVRSFLFARAELRSVLEFAPRYVRRVFGAAPPLRLSVFRDRDEPSFAQLLVEIVTGRTGEAAWAEADAALRQLHETWLVSLPRQVTRDVLLVTEPTY